MNIEIRSKVWRYPGLSGWYFIYVDKAVSEKLRRPKGESGAVRKGFVPVTARLGSTSWKTSLFPTKEGPYLLSIKASVRKAEGVTEGDKITVTCSVF